MARNAPSRLRYRVPDPSFRTNGGRFQFAADRSDDEDESEESEAEEEESDTEVEESDDADVLDAAAPTDKEWKPPGERKKGGDSRRGARGVVFDAE